jgi:glycosyltransferase involved in cell wall biosynthesis
VNTVAFAVPGDLDTPTGGYGYDRRIVAGLRARGWHVDVINLGDGFPHPPADVRKSAGARLATLATRGPVVVDGLALGVLPEAAEALHRSHQLVALVHHPLALETGLDPNDAEALRLSERAALSFAHHVITTSDATARLLIGDFAVPAERITVVRPGTDRVVVRPRASGDGLSILSVGSVVPRKGFDLLVDALARCANLPWRLTIVGDRGRSPDTVRQLDAIIVQHRLNDRISFTGAVAPESLSALYAAADLFVLASRFEGYGMAYAEAIAHGLPVVGTAAGAIPEAVPPGAGVLVPPDDVDALAAALHRLIASPAERATLAAGARKAASRLPAWCEQSALFARVLEGCR